MSVSIPRYSLGQQQQHQQHQQQPPPSLQLQLLPPQSSHISGRAAVLGYKMDQSLELDQNDISQQEAAARDYKPQLEGPLVGDKVLSQAITEAYARADPTYVAKTMALPQTYSHYRPIQGDGNCGWRAIAFAYFETLVKCGDINLIQSERQRLIGLNEYIEKVGGQNPDIFDFMVSETIDLLNDVLSSMSEGSDAMPILMARFNDSNTSMCLVYHLRLLASSRLKGNPAQYEPYLVADADPGVKDVVEDYIASTIMPVNREIDHISVVLLHDILLRPANIVLDIAYLDRSEGDEVNVHRLPEEANGQDPSTLGPIIYLLYRVGHYDILYRDAQVHIPSIPVAPAPVDLQINRVSFVHHNQDFENSASAMQDAPYTINMSTLAMIPGLSSSTLSPMSSLSPFGPPSTTSSPMTDPYASSPATSWASQPFTPETVQVPPPNTTNPPQQQATVHPLRFSKYNFQGLPGVTVENSSTHEPTCMTNTFKNSHFNTAHYNNVHFQPEMYQPDAEDEIPSGSNCKIGGRKRSSEHCPGIKKEKAG
ncbi:peptidase C65 Otubain-domain-containing protein [Xylaria nigripes]|nr:peptidase C65 Otubain-domain-containing protein [Xylaria nigripes]